MTTLEQSYARCRALNKAYGTTYYAATYALPRVKRHHVHALYGFCRYADDIVDAPRATPSRRPPGLSARVPPAPVEVREKALANFGDRFFADLVAGDSDDPVLKAVVHTVKAFGIDPDCFRRFLRSMTMDLTVRTYEAFDDLLDYMDGSAAVIGEMMLPILEPSSPHAQCHARDLGIAFQLTNFLRDVSEDLDRGRVYLPQEDLRRFGADPSERRVDAAWRELMRYEIERTRRYYASADLGITYLPATSARCIRAARRLYAEILERIESADYDVFTRRVRVPGWRKALVVGRSVSAARGG